jgi:hypothetical protein
MKRKELMGEEDEEETTMRKRERKENYRQFSLQ